jgi:HK97 family phage portal protein
MALGSWMRRIFTRSAPERRQGGMSFETAWNAGYSFSGSPYWAENIAAVTSATTIIARTIASLPAVVYRETPEGRVEAPDHPVARLIRRPDGDDGILSWPDFCEWFVASALLAGNGLAGIEDDGAGRPTRLRPIPWASSNPTINERTGHVAFHVAQAGSLPWWPTYAPQVVSSSDTLWLRDRTDVGVIGRSALSRAPQVVQLATDSQSFAGAMFGNGAKLSGVITHPGVLSKEASDRIASSWRATHVGPFATSRTAILEEGAKFEALSMTLEDAELLASRKFQTEEIARLFNIPLPILNIWDHSTFTNSDTASQWFGQLTLAPWCRKLEAEMSRTLINDPTFHVEIDLAALMRGSFATRIATEIAMVRAGVLSADEMRLAEGWPARGGAAGELQPQAVGGRPQDVGTGEGDTLPAPGAPTNGSGKPANGAG